MSHTRCALTAQHLPNRLHVRKWGRGYDIVRRWSLFVVERVPGQLKLQVRLRGDRRWRAGTISNFANSPRPGLKSAPNRLGEDDVYSTVGERYASRIEKSDEDREQDIHSLGRVSR